MKLRIFKETAEKLGQCLCSNMRAARDRRALESAGFAATRRLYAYGLAAAEGSSAAIEIQGLDERERSVTAIARHLREGRWIDPADPRGVVLGKTLAERLDVKVGSELMILGQAADGSTANEILVVRGVLRPIGERIDRTGVIAPAEKFRELFILEPARGAHELAVAATDLEAVRRVVRAADPTLEVLSWRELEPSLARMTDAAAARCLLPLLITYLAVVIVVTNATLMSVFERIRQFGIMKAIGTTPAQIARIILAEVLIQSAAAVAIAALLALPVCIYLRNTGLDLSHIIDEVSIGGAAMDPIWFGDISAAVFALPAAIILLSAIFAKRAGHDHGDRSGAGLAAYVALDGSMDDVFLLLIVLVVAAGVLNTMIVSVLERKRELGVMLAVGTSPARLFRLVVCEATLLGVVGLIAGSIAFIPWMLYMQRIGIDLTRFIGTDIQISGVLYDPILRIALRPADPICIVLALFALLFATAAYLAYRAARLPPIDSIRQA